MGFRSTFITEDYKGIEVPQWFVDKYSDTGIRWWEIKEDNKSFFPITLMSEWKFYSPLAETEIFLDIQKILVETDTNDIVLILLHECGGITRVKITQNSITGREPVEWKEVESVEHDYCYGCSDLSEVDKK